MCWSPADGYEEGNPNLIRTSGHTAIPLILYPSAHKYVTYRPIALLGHFPALSSFDRLKSRGKPVLTQKTSPRPNPHWLAVLNHEVVACTRCPRLVEYREQIAREKRRAYRDCEYWGKPVPGFGDPNARVLIMGLAPGAHGSNRTGRPFTGDASGKFMFPVLYETGFANQPNATDRNDGLELRDLYITAAVRCAPPANKPTPQELAECSQFLDREIAGLEKVKVVVALGKIGFDAYLNYLKRRGPLLEPTALSLQDLSLQTWRQLPVTRW